MCALKFYLKNSFFSDCKECITQYFEENPFGACPQCKRENKPLASKALKKYRTDNIYDLLINTLLKDVNVISKELLISLTTIEEHFTCPICLSVYKDTIITECLHRFCRSCITKSLVMETCKNKCPICKNGIESIEYNDLFVCR